MIFIILNTYKNKNQKINHNIIVHKSTINGEATVDVKKNSNEVLKNIQIQTLKNDEK